MKKKSSAFITKCSMQNWVAWVTLLLFFQIVATSHAAFAQAGDNDSDTASYAVPGKYILDMVHNNPGEAAAVSDFNNPAFLRENGYTGQVMNDFTFAHAAISYDRLNTTIFPQHSKERDWVVAAAGKVRENIKKAHAAGIKVYYFTDIIVLPKKLVELYHDEICDANGKISFERPKTIEIHRLMLKELFDSFPDLDGLVIRTGETYLNNVPYHTGNNPITNGVESHVKLINLLREEVCVKRNKMIFYRTWSFGGMHDDPQYYLDVVNQITPHPNLIFSIKHTKGDYQRTSDFNPTLTLGKHPQIVEVQCQREYEGKGAYPDYIMEGLINGFEEYSKTKIQKGHKSLNDIKGDPNFRGVWSWSRGGGWVGPYISNEFWCRVNAWVLSRWAANTKQTEEEVFARFMDENHIVGKSRDRFRELCLLSAKAILRGHESAELTFNTTWSWWMRDEFLGGIDPNPDATNFASEGLLYKTFDYYNNNSLLHEAVAEKFEAVKMWEQIDQLSRKISIPNKDDQTYIRVSSRYGLLLHRIIAEGWKIMALGFKGDQTGKYPKAELVASLTKYDQFWEQYADLQKNNPSCATLYKPYAFVYQSPNYHGPKGMRASIDKYRSIVVN